MKQPGKEKQIAKKIFLLSLKTQVLKCWNIQISGKAWVGWWGGPHCGGIAQIPGFVSIKAQSSFRSGQKPARNESPAKTNLGPKITTTKILPLDMGILKRKDTVPVFFVAQC